MSKVAVAEQASVSVNSQVTAPTIGQGDWQSEVKAVIRSWPSYHESLTSVPISTQNSHCVTVSMPGGIAVPWQTWISTSPTRIFNLSLASWSSITVILMFAQVGAASATVASGVPGFASGGGRVLASGLSTVLASILGAPMEASGASSPTHSLLSSPAPEP